MARVPGPRRPGSAPAALLPAAFSLNCASNLAARSRSSELRLLEPLDSEEAAVLQEEPLGLRLLQRRRKPGSRPPATSEALERGASPPSSPSASQSMDSSSRARGRGV